MAIPITFPPKRAFLSNPYVFSLTTPSKVEEKKCPYKMPSDYRDDIPKIREQILQSNNAHLKLCMLDYMAHKICNPNIPPDKFLPNLLGINKIAKSFLQTNVEYNPNFEPLIVETGNLIYQALKEERLESYYIENLERIIVLSSSNVSIQSLQSVFERYAFTTGFYPVVENNRTDYDDLKIHLSDEAPPREMPFVLPSKEEIDSYLSKNPSIRCVFSPNTISLISAKLENKEYFPEKTIYALARGLLEENILLGYTQAITLEAALIKHPKGVPSRK